MDEVKIGKIKKVWKSENSTTDEERKEQDREKLCKSIVKGLARRNREKHAILAEVGEEDQRVMCIEDVTGENCRGMKCAKFVHNN